MYRTHVSGILQQSHAHTQLWMNYVFLWYLHSVDSTLEYVLKISINRTMLSSVQLKPPISTLISAASCSSNHRYNLVSPKDNMEKRIVFPVMSVHSEYRSERCSNSRIIPSLIVVVPKLTGKHTMSSSVKTGDGISYDLFQRLSSMYSIIWAKSKILKTSSHFLEGVKMQQVKRHVFCLRLSSLNPLQNEEPAIACLCFCQNHSNIISGP